MEQWIKDFSADLLSKYQSRDFIFVRIYSLLGKILKFLYELNIDAKDLEGKIAQTYARLDSFNTSEQFFSWLNEICTLACQRLDSSLKTIMISCVNLCSPISGKTLKTAACACTILPNMPM